MAQIVIKTARRRDADVIAAFVQINASVDGQTNDWSLSAFIGPHGGNPQIHGTWGAVKDLPALKALLDANGSLALHFSANFPGLAGLHISLVRNLAEYVDTVQASIPENQQAPMITSVMKAIESGFPSYVAGDAIEKILGRDFADFYRARDESVTRIENTLSRLIEDADGYRRKLDQRHDEKLQQLELVTAGVRTQLQEEGAVRSRSLDERAAALDTQQKELDNSSARHARRALRQALQTQLKAHDTSFALTQGTAKKRSLIHFLFAAALVFDAGYTGFTLWRGKATLDSLPIIARLLVGVIGFAIIIVLYIRWVDLWFRQHADEEFRLKRMSLDVDRASWVVETAMEWQQQNHGPIPEQLLEELTRGLFMPSAGSPTVKHPVEDLASAVLGASSNLDIDIPGFGTATLKRRGIRRAIAAAAKNE